jgi:hypothetical protein
MAEHSCDLEEMFQGIRQNEGASLETVCRRLVEERYAASQTIPSWVEIIDEAREVLNPHGAAESMAQANVALRSRIRVCDSAED